jgi:hypothetical protein
MTASAIVAAVIPDNSDAKSAKIGKLRLYSAHVVGIGRDAPEAVVFCIQLSGAVVCTVATSCTTTGVYDKSCLLIGQHYSQTLDNI